MCRSVLLHLALLGPCLPAAAAVRLPAVISDHMVLQRGAEVPIWGSADPGEEVTVQLAGKERAVRADAQGKWKVHFDLSKAAPSSLVLRARGRDSSVVVGDILLGEVWLAWGQSNMVMPLAAQPGKSSNRDAATSVAAANYPQIRLFKVAQKKSTRPAEDVEGSWVVTTPEAMVASKFSAVAYYFGQRLHERLGVPVGLIDASSGGTRIEAWMPDEGPRFNGMVAPLAPFALRGAIWYQGESNLIEDRDIHQYAGKMERLVAGWRRYWGAELPFYFAQLAPHAYSVNQRRHVVDSPYRLPQFWEAQADATRIPGTGMVVTNDTVDDLGDIHPGWKQPVGQRFANLALAHTYGARDVHAFGPTMRAVSFTGGEAVVRFDHGEGLAARRGEQLTWFEIAGADGIYHPALARI